MIKSLLTLFLALSTVLYAGIEEYFHEIENKGGNHHIRNVDFIYIINLDKRPEKIAHCYRELQPYGITPFRFSAVNGWELSFKALNDLGVKYASWMPSKLWGTCYLEEDGGEPRHEVMHKIGRNYFCHCMSRGAIGICLSHLSLLQDAYDSGYETVWIMEDDIQVIKNPHLVSDMIDKLDQLVGRDNWDLLFTDQDTKDRDGKYVPCTGIAQRPNYTPSNKGRFATRTDINSDFRKVGARYGAYSYIVRRAGMKKILDFLKNYKIFLPYDLEFYLPNDVHMYTVRDDIVSTLPQALSDNGAPGYTNK